MIQDHEIDAWLGDTELEVDQWAHFARLVRAYDDLTADRDGDRADYAEEDSAAWVAAFEIATDGFDLAARGAALREARDAARQGAIVSILDGGSEQGAALATGISRPWIRKALGK